MDNVWANAWSDPASEPKPAIASTVPPTWSAPAPLNDEVGRISIDWHDAPNVLGETGWGGNMNLGSTQEANVPWSTGSSEDPTPSREESLDDPWRSSSDEIVDLSQPTETASDPSELPGHVQALVTHEELETEIYLHGRPIREDSAADDALNESNSATGTPKIPQTPNDAVEGFGTFESALEDPSAAWEPAYLPPGAGEASAFDEGWGSTWVGAANDDSRHLEETRRQLPEPDEWATAQKEKDLREARVPEELILSLLAEWAEMSLVLFPPITTSSKDGDEAYDDGLKHLETL